MKKKHHVRVKSRHLLVIMTTCCIALVCASLTFPSVSAPVRDAVSYVVSPFQKGINAVGTYLAEQFSGFSDVKALKSENDALKSQVDDLTSRVNELSQQQTELSRLEELYGIDQEYPDYPKVGAKVIGKSTGNWYSTFVIDKGTDDGIETDMNVVGQGGLIGIVTSTGKSWAEVRSIIDDESNVSAMAADTSALCTVTGDLAGMDSGKIKFVGLRDTDNQVSEGTGIVTSNVSEKFLPGILIGYVSDITVDSGNLTKSGTIIPAADFDAVREVLVITQLKQTKENSD